MLPSNRMFDTFTSPDKFKAIYDKLLAFAHRAQAMDQAVLGQCRRHDLRLLWKMAARSVRPDGPSLRLEKQGKPIVYMAPQEGAMAWMDGWALTQAAQNLPQAYEWINYLHTPEVAAMVSNGSGYNPVVKGAEAFLSPEQKNVYLKTYPEDALSKLWMLMPAPPWYLDLRAQYADKLRLS